MRSSLEARNAASSVRGYYRGKTAAIINRYGPGPRVHYHLGLFGKSRPAPRATAEQLRAQIVAAQERLLDRAGAAWSADSAFAGNLLDLGCGLGGGAIYWAQHFPVEVTAVTNVVEHAEVVRDLAAAAGVADRVHPLVADAARLPSSERYAAAVAVESSCCMPRSLLFQRVAALLVPGGVFGIDDAFLADLTWRAAFDDYWTARIGTLLEYRQAAAQAGLALEQDLDVTAETSEFWRFSIAWARAKMAEPALSPADRTRLARSVSWHRLFLRGWREGAYQHHFLRFRKQRQGRRRAAGTRLLVRQYWHSGQRPGVRA